MPEKLDLFEMTIKRGLENYELPLDESSWSEFEQALGGSKAPTSTPTAGGGAFLPKFGIAAAFLAGALLFINQSAHDTDTTADQDLLSQSEVHVEPGDSNAPEDHHESIKVEDADSNKSASDISAEKDIAIESEVDENSSLSEAEKIRMERINSKLQKAAKVSSNDENESSTNTKKRSTTRYLGADFNLGASKSFSPNNDGKNDAFLPSRLEDGDIFLMTIADEAGQVVFTSSDVSLPWDGTDTVGNELEEGRYSWEVILQKDKKKEIFKGIVKLER